jgi:hypothetical protein
VKVVESGPLRPTITVSSIVDRRPPIEAGASEMPQTLFAQPAEACQPVDPAWAHGRAEALVLLPTSTVDGYEASGPLAGSAIWCTKITRLLLRKLFTQVQPRPTGTCTIAVLHPGAGRYSIHMDPNAPGTSRQTHRALLVPGVPASADLHAGAPRAPPLGSDVERAVRAAGQ